MTTAVTVACPADHVAFVQIKRAGHVVEEFVVQPNESRICHLWADREINIREEAKTP